MALTDVKIRNAKPEGGKKKKLFDGNGLYIEIAVSGSKFWRYKYRFEGREKLLTIGSYPKISLRQARVACAEAHDLLDQGVDPGAAKQKARKEKEEEQAVRGRTFAVVAREWYETKGLNLTPKYRLQKWQKIEKHLLPHIGDTPFAELTLQDFIRVTRLLADRPDMSLRVAQIAGQICRFARVMQYTSIDISAGLVEALPDRPPRRHRSAILDPDAFGNLLCRIAQYPGTPIVRLALQIISHVFCRSGELVGARWEEIDFDKDLWTIPARRMKRRRVHLVPLSRQVKQMFLELREWAGDSAYCFPSTYSSAEHISIDTMLVGLLRLGYTRQEVSVHGFRATASTMLNTLRFRPDAIELQLAHVENNAVRAAYNRADLLDERREMLQKWSDYLDELQGLCRRAAPPARNFSQPWA